MFCGNCGKELKEGASFCSNCGMKIGASVSEISKNPVKTERLRTRNARKKIWIPVILVICLVAGYFGYQKVVEYVIATQIDQTMAVVQSGVDNETADQILEYAVPQMVGDEMISDIILDNVSGEDVMDVYHALMRYMNYEVVDVSRVEQGHYQATVQIHNLNNGFVAAHATDIFMERYNVGLLGKIEQFLNDASADKSQLIAEVVSQSADECYESGDKSYWVSSTQIIDVVYSDGEWTPDLDVESFAYCCLGLN